MLKKLFPLLLSALLVLSACGSQPATQTAPNSDGLTIAATTYPVFLLTQAVTQDVPGLSVTPMVNQAVSCLHDYTLTVNDMRVLESADVIIQNGAGLEENMDDAFSAVENTPRIDCSQGISLLAMTEDGEQEEDPHIWMDPTRACQMLRTIAQELGDLDPDHAQRYDDNAEAAIATVTAAYETQKARLADLSCRELITFHDGFQYFAQAFDLTILRSIEEEAGSEASAKEVASIISDIQTHALPAIFTEVNGATATAESIQREINLPVFSLDLIMSGSTEGANIDTYLSGITANIDTILEAYS